MTTGIPAVPGPLRVQELGVMPMQKAGRPTGRMPSMSRIRPSVTNPVMPRLRPMAIMMSPATAVRVNVSVGDEDRVPRLRDLKRGKNGEIVARPRVTGDDGRDEFAVVGVERLDAVVECTASVHAIDDKAGGNIAQSAQDSFRRSREIAANSE